MRASTASPPNRSSLTAANVAKKRHGFTLSAPQVRMNGVNGNGGGSSAGTAIATAPLSRTRLRIQMAKWRPVSQL